MAHDTDARLIEAVHGAQSCISRIQIFQQIVVAKFIALDQPVFFWRPPMEDERDGDAIAGLGQALADIDGERVFLQPLVGNGDMLGDHQAGERAVAFGPEQQYVHRASVDLDDFGLVHGNGLPDI